MKLSDINPCSECGGDRFEICVFPSLFTPGEYFIRLECLACFDHSNGENRDVNTAFDLAVTAWNEKEATK